ncbi:uncharacterized protein MONBRDRAFT_23642 [Monosiga brevicollis MX1]|uniref:Uncharacterized protein n=1 Tax=Monosiga brevicollis TaxID=81824 RepID=A9UU18_MONBE|nr:uncharacterized protein MONBRDRAFT_23642 [Monosiga brevicollis MX1]EDQ91344.1 predicted protein [Monosiga brevicollis MX1]|eukprot:XP_001743766.1 hypothetical protein [Monosiga brevicollis MX1]
MVEEQLATLRKQLADPQTAISPGLETYNALVRESESQQELAPITHALLQVDPAGKLLMQVWEQQRTRFQYKDIHVVMRLSAKPALTFNFVKLARLCVVPFAKMSGVVSSWPCSPLGSLSKSLSRAVRRPGLARKSKTNLLNPSALLRIGSLYSYVEPEAAGATAEGEEAEADTVEGDEIKDEATNPISGSLASDGTPLPKRWRPNSKRTVGNHVLFKLLCSLSSPLEDSLKHELALTILKYCPELLPLYFAQPSLSCEPQLVVRWLAAMTLAAEALQLPLPGASWFGAVGTLSHRLESILPECLRQSVLHRCLSSSSPLILHATGRCLVAVLRRAMVTLQLEVSGGSRLVGLRSALLVALRGRLPDPQDVLKAIAVLSKLTPAWPAAVGNYLAILQLYQPIFPVWALAYDMGRWMPAPHQLGTTPDQVQMALLQTLRKASHVQWSATVPSARLVVGPPRAGQKEAQLHTLSRFGCLLALYSWTESRDVRTLARRMLVEQLLHLDGCLPAHELEAGLWIDALPSDPVAIATLDIIYLQTAKQSLKWLDRASQLADESGQPWPADQSPLCLVAQHQLDYWFKHYAKDGRQASAVLYVCYVLLHMSTNPHHWVEVRLLSEWTKRDSIPAAPRLLAAAALLALAIEPAQTSTEAFAQARELVVAHQQQNNDKGQLAGNKARDPVSLARSVTDIATGVLAGNRLQHLVSTPLPHTRLTASVLAAEIRARGAHALPSAKPPLTPAVELLRIPVVFLEATLATDSITARVAALEALLYHPSWADGSASQQALLLRRVDTDLTRELQAVRQHGINGESEDDARAEMWRHLISLYVGLVVKLLARPGLADLAGQAARRGLQHGLTLLQLCAQQAQPQPAILDTVLELGAVALSEGHITAELLIQLAIEGTTEAASDRERVMIPVNGQYIAVAPAMALTLALLPRLQPEELTTAIQLMVATLTKNSPKPSLEAFQPCFLAALQALREHEATVLPVALTPVLDALLIIQLEQGITHPGVVEVLLELGYLADASDLELKWADFAKLDVSALLNSPVQSTTTDKLLEWLSTHIPALAGLISSQFLTNPASLVAFPRTMLREACRHCNLPPFAEVERLCKPLSSLVGTDASVFLGAWDRLPQLATSQSPGLEMVTGVVLEQNEDATGLLAARVCGPTQANLAEGALSDNPEAVTLVRLLLRAKQDQRPWTMLLADLTHALVTVGRAVTQLRRSLNTVASSTNRLATTAPLPGVLPMAQVDAALVAYNETVAALLGLSYLDLDIHILRLVTDHYQTMERLEAVGGTNSIVDLYTLTSQCASSPLLRKVLNNNQAERRAVVELLLYLVKRKPESLQGALGDTLAVAYHGTLEAVDCLIQRSLAETETSSGRGCGPEQCIVGEEADVARHSLSGVGDLRQSAACRAGLGRLDELRMQETLRAFPRERRLHDSEEATGGMDLDTDMDPDTTSMETLASSNRNTNLVTAVYDPRFILALARFCVADVKLDLLRELVDCNVLSFVILCLTSEDASVRLVAAGILGLLRQHLKESTSDIKFAVEVHLDLLGNSMDPGMLEAGPLQTVHALFVARALRLALRPDSVPMHPIVTDYITSRPFLDLEDTPLFFRLLYSSDMQQLDERRWLFRFLTASLQSEADFFILCRRHVFELVMSFALAPVCDVTLLGEVLRLLRQACQHSAGVRDLSRRFGLLPWLAARLGLMDDCRPSLHLLELWVDLVEVLRLSASFYASLRTSPELVEVALMVQTLVPAMLSLQERVTVTGSMNAAQVQQREQLLMRVYMTTVGLVDDLLQAGSERLAPLLQAPCQALMVRAVAWSTQLAAPEVTKCCELAAHWLQAQVAIDQETELAHQMTVLCRRLVRRAQRETNLDAASSTRAAATQALLALQAAQPRAELVCRLALGCHAMALVEA